MTDKPSVVWFPSDDSNYTGAWREPPAIDRVVIHVTQGSWSSAINWFRNPAANASANYVIRSSDGRIAQCVSDRNIAWHAGNWAYNERSVGIEHEGYVDDPGWFTEKMYRSSARLVAFLGERWGIPLDRASIIGHSEVPGADHTDPGEWWWWSYFMDLVREESAERRAGRRQGPARQ